MKIDFKDEAEARSYAEKNDVTNLEATVGGVAVELKPETVVTKAQINFNRPEPRAEIVKPTTKWTSYEDRFMGLKNNKWEGQLYKAQLNVAYDASDASITATPLANAAALVTDELLPIQVIPFQSELLKEVRKIPVAQNSFRVLQLNINESAVGQLNPSAPTAGQGYGIASTPPAVGFSSINSTVHQAVELIPYGGGFAYTDALMDDVPSFTAQATQFLTQEVDANLEYAIMSGITGAAIVSGVSGAGVGNVSTGAVLSIPRNTSGKIVEADVWDLLASFYMQGLKRPAFIGSPATLAQVYAFRDQLVGRIAEQGGMNALGKPLVTLLGFDLIPTMYAPATGNQGDFVLADRDKLLLGVKGTGLPRTRVNPYIYMQWVSQWIQVDLRAAFATAYTSTIQRNGIVYGSIVQLKSQVY